MTELERTGAKSTANEAGPRLASGHLPPVRLQGRPSPDGVGWAPTAWKNGTGKGRS